MRAIVSGGTGFIGKVLIKRLIERGWSIYVLTRTKGKAEKMFENSAEELTWSDELQFPKAEVLFQLAGVIKGKGYEDFSEGNIEFLREVRKKAEGRVEKIIQLSSQAAGGPSPNCQQVDESSSSPVSFYGRTKLEGEKVIKKFHGDWVILRPSGVFGQGDEAFLELFRVLKRGIIPWMGEKFLSMIYVEDLVETMVKSVELASKETFNVSMKDPVSYWEFALKIAREIGVKKPKKIPVPYPLVYIAAFFFQLFPSRLSMFNLDKLREMKQKCWIINSEKAYKRGILEETPFDEAIKTTVSWYKKEGWI